MRFSICIALIEGITESEVEKLKCKFPFVLFKAVECINDNVVRNFDVAICGEYQALHKNILGKGRLRCIVCAKNKALLFNNLNFDYSSFCITDILSDVIVILDKQPFISSEALINELSNNKSIECLEQSPEHNTEIINDETAAIVVIGKDSSFAKNVLRFSKENVVAYYDIKKEKFIDRSGNENVIHCDTIYILNTLNSPASKIGIEQRFPNYKKIYIGQFGEFENFENVYYENFTKEFKTPTAIISSFGPEMGKFEVLCELNNQFKNNHIPVGCVSSNPCAAVISKIRYIEYVESQNFQTTVSIVRDLMSDIEEENNELVIWDIPGGCTQVDNLRTDYGGLTYACLCALRNVDVVILCFSSQINNQLIKKQCRIFESFGVSKVILVQSDMLYLRTMIAEGKLSVYENENFEKMEIEGYDIFNMNEVKEGKLYNYLFELFTEEGDCR